MNQFPQPLSEIDQNIDITSLCSQLTEAYTHLQFDTFFNILKMYKHKDLINHAIGLMTSPFIYAKNQEYPNIFYMLTLNNSATHFEDIVRILGIDKSKECIKQDMFCYCNVFQAFWLKKQWGICKQILNLLTSDERQTILLQIIHSELHIYFTLYLDLNFPSKLHHLLIPHIVNLNIEHRIDLSAMSGLPLLEILLCLPYPELITSEEISLIQYLWLGSKNLVDAKSLTLAALKNNEIQLSLLEFVNDKNNSQINCIIKAVEKFDGSPQYIAFIEKLLSALGKQFQISIQQNRQKYDVLFELLLQFNSIDLTALIVKHIDDINLLVDIYQELITFHLKSNDIKKCFLWPIIQHIINIFDIQQSDPLLKISNAADYKQLLNEIAQSQQNSQSCEINQAHIECLITYFCVSKNFSLAKILLSLFTEQEQQHFLIQQPSTDNAFPGILLNTSDRNPIDPIKPILSLTDPKVMINALLSKIPSLDSRYVQFAWLKTSSTNAIEIALFLSRHLDIDSYLTWYLTPCEYQQKNYGNIFNCLIEHDNENNALALLYFLKDQAYKALLEQWIEHRHKNNLLPLTHRDALCYLLRVRKIDLIKKLLASGALNEDHIKSANLKLNRQGELYPYLLSAINRGMIMLFRIGVSILEDVKAKQLLQHIVKKPLKDGELQHNLLTYAFLEFNSLTPAQLIEMINITKRIVGAQITELISLPYNATENIFNKLIKINHNELNMLIIGFFQKVVELNSLSENIVKIVPDCPAKSELLNIIQAQIKKITPSLPVLSTVSAPALKISSIQNVASDKDIVNRLPSTRIEISQLAEKLHKAIDELLRQNYNLKTFSQSLPNDLLARLNKYNKLLNHYETNDCAICLITYVILHNAQDPLLIKSFLDQISQGKLVLGDDLRRYMLQQRNGQKEELNQQMLLIFEYVNSNAQEIPRLDTLQNGDNVSRLTTSKP